jgi:hypothetical protein
MPPRPTQRTFTAEANAVPCCARPAGACVASPRGRRVQAGAGEVNIRGTRVANAPFYLCKCHQKQDSRAGVAFALMFNCRQSTQ